MIDRIWDDRGNVGELAACGSLSDFDIFSWFDTA